MPHRIAVRFARRWWGTVLAVCIPLAAVTAVYVIQQDTLTQVRAGQVQACERGNQIRGQLAEDNQAAIQTTRDLLAGYRLSADQRAAYQDALTRRLTRADELHPFPCHTLR